MSDDAPETNEALLARYKHVKEEIAKRMRCIERLKLGTAKRFERIKFVGCLNFTLGMIESEIESRGLEKPK